MDEGVTDSGSPAGAWADLYRELTATPLDSLDAEDLHRLGMSAYLTGLDREAEDALARSHQAWLDAGEVRRAAREAFWIGLMHVDRHEMSQAGGWFARGSRLIEAWPECAEAGLLSVPAGLMAMMSGEPDTGLAVFRQAAAAGDRSGDRDLCALARLGEGQCLVAMGQTEAGMRLLDEVMVGVVADDTSAIVSGLVFCAVIETCQKVLDLRRSAEWTAALSDWCESRPDMQSHRGRCLVHRAEVARCRGEWEQAEADLDAALAALGEVQRPAVAAAHYERGELHRLRGEVDEAHEAYRRARQHGHDANPGFALLLWQQGRAADAWRALPASADLDVTDPGLRAAVLAATVDIGLDCGHGTDAVDALRALRDVAATTDTTYLHALADFCEGRVLLDGDEPDAAAACGPLRRAITTWQAVDAPLEAARARVAFGAARAALGDGDTAASELDAARRTFDAVGARPDLQILERSGGDVPRPLLTDREVEVLASAAAGLTNREIAERLHVSPHTVRRHLQNVFAKIGVSTRAAAISWAHRHGLLR